ncbi:MAG: isoamylase early set domain-containing protein [Anaerolineae bacterium]|nr:isoamylase early set domain-containing protein [Anaerolineae bacterium]
MLKRKGFKSKEKIRVTFILPEGSPPASVVGDFNDWNPEANPLILRSNHTYSSAVELDKGQRYAFRYQLANGGWLNEEDADAKEPNKYGSSNSIIIT